MRFAERMYLLKGVFLMVREAGFWPQAAEIPCLYTEALKMCLRKPDMLSKCEPAVIYSHHNPSARFQTDPLMGENPALTPGLLGCPGGR